MKNLLIIDPYFRMISPALKSVLREFPKCFDDFDEVEIWSIESDFSHPKLKIDSIYCPFRLWQLVSVWYWFAAHLRYFYRYVLCKKQRPTIIQATNYYCYAADLIYFHFSFLAFRKIIKQHSKIFKMSYFRSLVFWTHYAQEWILLRLSSPSWWWVVSGQLMKDTQETSLSSGEFRVLPNSYDNQRFNSLVREQNRERMRAQLGFAPEEAVLIFVSLGALERKGFGLAAKAISLLYQRGCSVKLLFVGGPTPEPSDLRPFLKNYGVHDLSFLKVVGRVTDIENYMAAADGLLFPSYCEAFALVEIEAAAMGLRLYLTPHYGSEMILRESVNGRYLPWDVEGMANVIEEEIYAGNCKPGHQEMGQALTGDQFLAALRERYQEILHSKIPVL